MKVSSLLLLGCLALSAPLSIANASERAHQGWQMIEQGALLLDVRTPSEFLDGHLTQAVNYPLSDLTMLVEGLDKSRPIVLYCRSGHRSGKAYQIMSDLGFTQLHNAGGYREMLEVKPLP